MADSTIYEIPKCVNVHGLNLHADAFKPVIDRGTNFDEIKLNKEDVVIASFPRTGTTWLTQIVTLLMSGDDYDNVSNTLIQERAIFTDMTRPGDLPEIERLEQVPSPRVIKTHLSYPFLNRWVDRDGCKVIVPIRNPKDTLVSIFHFYQTVNALFDFQGTWNDFFEHVKAGKTYNGDPVDWILTWWKEKEHKNILFLKYEDMLENLPEEMRKITKFLNLEISDVIFEKIVEDASFAAMSKNPNTNYTTSRMQDHSRAKFMRSGKVGQWKQFFTVRQNEWFNEKYEKTLADAGLQMTYE